MATLIQTDEVSLRYRAKAINVAEKRLLVTNLRGTLQAEDLTVPPNCDGFGRIRHFRRQTADIWPQNPLPIDPVSRKLGLPRRDEMLAQVFQNAVCNWRCWYCYVPFDLLSANQKYSAWKSADDLVELYLAEKDRPPMIDLSGGQPDLVPEWVPWTMEALTRRGVMNEVFLWSDDNLSNDYFWRFLSDEQQAMVAGYRNYAKVCCFKGFDAASFSFNTKAEPRLFDRQFEIFGRYLKLRLDLYAYATFTAPDCRDIRGKVEAFVDRLQALAPNLPLRVIPLEVRSGFKVVKRRHEQPPDQAMEAQRLAIEAWNDEVRTRFSSQDRALNVAEVSLAG